MMPFLLIGGGLFALCILAGFAMDRYVAWKPRHDLDRLFQERRRERVAVTRLPQPAVPPVTLELVKAS